MATPTLTNLTSAETYRTTLADLTDMVVSGTGPISILLGISATAGTLDYLPGSTGNLALSDLGFGQYLLSGDAADLSTSLANLAFIPATGFFGTFEMQVNAGNAEGVASGVKTVSFDLADGDAIALGDGSDDIFLFKTLIGTATVDGGTGQDTLLVQGSDALTIDFSQAGQQVTSGSPNVEYSGFENLDAALASGVMTVIAGTAGGSILTGSGNDQVTLGAGADTLDTGAGNDVVSGAFTSGDSIALGAGDDQVTFSDANASVDGGADLDTLLVTGSDALRVDFNEAGSNTPDASTQLSNFENLDAATASGALDVTLAAGSTSIRTGSGADTIAFRDVVASVNAGTGSDILRLTPSLLSAPAASTAMTINLGAAANTQQITAGAPLNASWQNFEHLDAGSWDKNLTVTANVAGSLIATGSGVDSVTLGAGADHVHTGAGNDRVIGAIGAGDDIDLDVGNDTATFASTASGVVRGGADVDTLFHAGGAVTINLATNSHFTGFENLSAATATGAVTFTGVAGTTSVATGAGNDVINVAAASGAVSINAGAGNNTITAGAGGDSITLSAGVDNIRAGGGNDVIVGNLSVGDRVLLEGGNDTITLPTTAIAVTVDGGTGSDTLVVRGSAAQTFNFAGSDDNGALAGSYTNFENINASAATGALTVTGVAATTSVSTGRGNDIINVASAAQGVTINAGNGVNTVTGSAFADTITLGTGKDIINAGNGADTVIGNLTAGDQVLLQGSNDTFAYRALTATGTLVDGGTGVDTLTYAGSTAKTFNFASAADNVTAETGLYKAFENLDASGASGAVTVTGAATTNRISGGGGADVITATTASGGVRVDAGAGNDKVTTGGGADTIVHGSGVDNVDAGAGIDTLEVGAGDGDLTINFAVAAGSDQVDSASLYKNLENLDGTNADGVLNVTLGAATRVVITGSGDDTVHTGAVTTVTASIAMGAGDDSVVVDTTNTNLGGATVSGVEHLVLANNVDATLSLVQNALLDSADGSNTVTLASAGSAQGAALVETYRLANGSNDFTLGAAAQNVTGGTGNDTVHSAALTSLTGTLALGGGSDTLAIDSTATDLSALTLTAVESITLGNDVSASMTIAENALVTAAAGNNTITLVDAGVASGAATVENYLLANGANTFTLGAAAQNVSGGSGDDTLQSGSLSSIAGTLDGVSGDDLLLIENDAAVSATLSNIDAVHLASGVDVTTSIATANLITSAAGVNSVSLTDAGTLTGKSDVESYHLADGGNDFTLGAAAQNVTGGSGDDVFNSDNLASLGGTLVGGGGNDVLNIQSSMQLSATLTDIDTIVLASNIDLTTIIADNALIGSAAGSNFVTLLDAGTLTGAAEVEAYRLADGGNTFTLGDAGQSVIGGSGNDVVHSGAFTTLTGTYTLDGGDDSVVLDTNLTNLAGATLTAVEHVVLATDVDATVTLAQNALIDAATGDNSVTLSAAGTASGAAAVEHYVLADGANDFTLGAAAQTVQGGSGDDVVHSGALTSLNGSLALGGGNDTLVVDTTATDISGLSLTSVEAIALASNVDAAMTIAENAVLGTASGANTVTLSDAGTASGKAEVENYQLANGSNTFTLGAAAHNVTGGTGDDTLNTGALTTVSGALNGGSGNDVVNVDTSATLSATLTNIDSVNLGANVDITTSLANNVLLAGAAGVNTVTLNEAGTASGAAAVENYVLADGGNAFTLGAAAQNVSGGSGDDVVHSGALTTVSGTLALAGGNDKLVVDTTGTNIAAATLSAVEAVELANNVSITSSITNNALIVSALGGNTVTLSAAGTASGAAEVENYVLADGINTFTLGASAQNVTGGTGDDSLKSGVLTTVSGTLDGVSGNDTLTIEQSATLSASLNNIDAVNLANNVNLTTSITNNALIAGALGANTVTLSNAGAASGAAAVENYQLANGANSFTLGAAAQNVSGDAGDDVVHSGAFTSVSGTLALGGGNDTLIIDTTATDISSATLTDVEGLQLANNVNASMRIAQHALLGSAAGANTVTLTDAGSVTGAAEVESYQLADGGNTFTLGANGQDVTGGSGADVMHVVDTQLSGAVLDGAGARDTLVVTSIAGGVSAIGGTLNNIEIIDLTGVANGATFTATAAVDDLRGGAGADTLNVAAAASGVTVAAGSGADLITGSANNDVIDVGVDGDADTVNAGGGSDTVTNFGAGDTIDYEGGADTSTYAAVNATIDGGSAVDTLTVTATSGAMSFDFSQVGAQQITAGGTGLYRNFENLAAGAVGVDDALTVVMASTTTAVTTGSGDDSITFRSQNVTVDAGAGADTLIMGGSGVIVIDLSAAGDQVGGLGSYTNFEDLDGSGSSATLVVIAGGNTAFIKTGSGNDSISGGVSIDGGSGGNNITADARTTTVVAGAGNDNLDATAAAQALNINLGDGANAVLGSDFDDVITLGAGIDSIDAGAGSDTIVGVVSAADSIGLGSDADSFTYQALSGAASIVDGGSDSDTLVVGAGGSALTIDFSSTNDQVAAETGSYRNFENLAAGSATVDLTVTTGSAGGLIVTGSGDDDVTVSAANDDVSTGAGDDVINVTAATLNSAIDAGGNTGVGDTLNVLGGGTLGMSVTAVGIENVSLAVATDFTANALSGLRITGSAGDDTITVGAGDQVVAGAGGDDVIKVSDALLGGSLSIDGGAANSSDVLQVTSDATVIDSDFTLVTSIELLQLTADAVDDAQSISVGALAEAGGLVAIDTTGAGANDQVTIDASAFSASLIINSGGAADHIVLGAGGSVVNAGGGDNTLTIGAANDGVTNDVITSGSGDDYLLATDAQLTANLGVSAGAGTDTLEVSTDASVVDADFAGLGSVERLLLGANAGDDAQSVTLASNAAAAGINTVAVVDSALADAITLDASGFNNALTVNTGAGNDLITLGSGGSVIDAQGGDNLITVGAANDGSHDDHITTLGGADRIIVSDAQLSHFLLFAAGAGIDTVEVNSDALVLDADLAGLVAVEKLKLSADAVDNAQSVTLAAAADSAGITTVDGTAAGADDALTIDSTAFSGALTVNTGAGSDIINLGAGGSTVDSGDGNDFVKVGAANDGSVDDHIATGVGSDAIEVDNSLFTEHLVLDGGSGVDTLRVNGDVSVVDADFTQINSVEALTLIADAVGNLNQLTLGSAAAASGMQSIDSSPGGNNDVLQLDARNFANTLNITSGAAGDIIQLGSGGSVVNAGDGDNSITVGAVNDGVHDDVITTGTGNDVISSTNGQFTDHLTVSAGGGLDTLEVSTDASVIDADFGNLTSVEVLKLAADAADNAQSVVLAAQAATAGVTTIDATSVGATDAVSIDASAFANALIIDTAAGSDHITLGAGGSVVDAGDGDNLITLGADNDGVHDDAITTGSGSDHVQGSAAQLNSHLVLDAGGGVDTFEVTSDAALVDTDFGGVDGLEILKLGADAVDNDQSVSLAAAASAAGLTTVDAGAIGADDTLTINASGFNTALTISSAASHDLIFLGAGGSTVNSGDGNDEVSAGAINDGSVDDHIDLGTGNDTVLIDSDNFTSHFVLDGGEDFDILRLNGDVLALDADFTQVSRLEKIAFIADASGDLHQLTLGSAAATTGVESVDASAAGNDDVIVIDAHAFANALSIDTLAADDVITLGTGGSVVNAGDGANTIVVGAANDGSHHDQITTGAGADLIKTTDARLSNDLVINAGGGSDTLEVTDDAAVLDAALTQIASVEVLKLSGNALDNAQSVTLAAHAAATGITSVNATAIGADDALTVDASAFANALTINSAAGDDLITLGSGGSVVNAGRGANTIFVGADNDGVHDDHITTGVDADVVNLSDAQLSANFTFSAGGGGDELRITSDASVLDADLAGLTSVETLTLTVDAGDNAQSVVLGANAEAAGITTVDGIGLISTDVLTIDASAFSHGLSVTTSLGDDVVILGSGGSLVTTLDGDDTVTVGAANDGTHNDDIGSGDGNDLIKTSDAQLSANLSVLAGAGSDTLEVTSDASVADADFTNLGSVERLTLSADAGDDGQSLTLGSHAHTMGLAEVDTTAAGANDDVSIDAGAFSGGLTIATGAGNDTIILGSAGSTVTSGLGDDTVTAGASLDDIATDAGDDTINVTATTIAAAVDGGGNTGGGDTLRVTGGGAVLMGNSVINLENVTLVSATDFIANGTSGLAITGSTGNDTVHVGAGDQVIAGAGGDDIIDAEDSELTAALSVDGGAHGSGDILLVSTDASVADADLANVTTMEVLKLGGDAGDHAQSVTFGSNAAAAGFTHIDTSLVGIGETVDIDSTAFANALTIDGGAGREVVVLGAGGSVVSAGAGADQVTVGADNDGVHDDVINLGESSDVVLVTDARLSAHLTVVGGGGSDRLTVSDDAAVVDADLAGISELEVLKLSADAVDDAQSVILAGNAASAGINTLDAADVGADDNVSINAAGFANALSVTTSSGDDAIVLGSGGSVVHAGDGANTVTVGALGDAITTGSGDDVVKVDNAVLGSSLTIAAGGGSDTLEVTSDADIDFNEVDNMTSVEVLKLSGNAADNAQVVSLGAAAVTMGLNTIDSTAVDGSDDLALRLAQFSGALTVNTGAGVDDIVLGSGGSVVDSGNGNDAITVGAANDGVHDDHIASGDGHDLVMVLDAQLSSHLQIDAGNGVDALVLDSDTTVLDADFTLMTNLEQVLFDVDAADNAQSITVAALAAAAGVNRIDAGFAGANDVISIDASGFVNALTIVTNDAADVIVLGSGGSVVDAKDGDNLVTVGAANDGVHNDSITSGNGADVFNVSDAQLTGNLAIAAGGGTDILLLSNDAAVVDADFAQMTGVEVFKFGIDAGDDAQSAVLAANAMAAGFATVDLSLAGASDAVTVDASAYTLDLTVILHAGIDNVTLGSGNDTLLGGVSAGDVINLGAGNDSFAITTLAAVTIDGGIDLDTLVIGAGAGSRQIDFSNGVDQLSGAGTYLNFENLAAANANGTLSVLAGHATTSIVTGSRIDQVDAGLADQGVSISTGASGDGIIGSAHNDSIDGGAGDDFIAGGDGNDALTGGTGSDTFVFDTALNAGSNVDTVSDFVSGSDVFQLNLDIFSALQATDGVLDADNFLAGAGAVAATATQHIILDTTSGSLYYDADGAGGVTQIEFSRLGGAHTAVATDFVIG